MHPWNVLATSKRFSESRLRRQLSPFKGKWRHTGFRDVIVGWVEDMDFSYSLWSSRIK